MAQDYIIPWPLPISSVTPVMNREETTCENIALGITVK